MNTADCDCDVRALSKLKRYYWTVRYLKVKQILYLIARRVLKVQGSASLPADWAVSDTSKKIVLMPLEKPCLLDHSTYQFLNEARTITSSADWNQHGVAKLWLYNLHYFDWIRQPGLDKKKILATMNEWVEANAPFRGTGWEPYPVSLRLVNWTSLLDDAEPDLVASFALQTIWLAKNLEYDLQANHLFTNLKALVFATSYLSGSTFARINRDASRSLLKEVEQQFLSDGGHYERSMMYHLILTADLIDLCNLMQTMGHGEHGEFIAQIRRRAVEAMHFANKVDPPDSSVPCFNDSVSGIAPSCPRLNEYAAAVLGYSAPEMKRKLYVESLASSGYFVIREADNFMIIDCGDIGPDFQPGHAHCDTLSFEFHQRGKKLITNCGNHNYSPSSERYYARSTAAHNTVVVDGEEQSEVWGAFRAARRARPIDPHVLLVGEEHARFSGGHDGYGRLRGAVVHRREIDYHGGGHITVCDIIEGQGSHKAESYVHFVPGLTVRRVGDLFEIHSSDGTLVLQVTTRYVDEAEILWTDRYPEFGLKLSAMSLCLRKQGVAPFDFGYELAPGPTEQ